MIAICIQCNRLFEAQPEFEFQSEGPTICPDCVASAVTAYFDVRTRILRSPIGRVLAEEILKDAA